MKNKRCKSCGRDVETLPAKLLYAYCPYCGHSYHCSGCDACRRCPKCGMDKHRGDCKSTIELPRPDIVAYLEVARMFMTTHRPEVQDRLDMHDEEFERLKKQLDGYIEETTS